MSSLDIDPSTVPYFPCVRIELRQASPGGQVEGLVEGVVVATDPDVSVVRGAVVSEVAEQAAAREGAIRAVRTTGVGVDGSSWDQVITADGQVLEVTAPTAPGSSGRPSPVVLGCAGFLLVLVLAVAGVVVVVSRHPAAPMKAQVTRTVAPAPSPTQLPVVGPAGSSSQAAWSVPLGTPTGSTATVGIDGQRVYAADAGHQSVAAYQSSTGRAAWSAKVDGPVVAGPMLAMIDGASRVVAATNDHVYAWVPGTGAKSGSWSTGLPGAGTVRLTGTGPVVGTDANHVRIVVGGQLVTRVVPADATPIAPGSAGSLIVAGAPGQVWSVGSAQVAGSPIVLTAPAGTAFSAVVGSTSTRLVAAFTKTTSGGSAQVVLRAFTVGSWAPLWTTVAIPSSQAALTGGGTLPLVVSPDGSWGIYGSTTVAMSSGTTAGLPTDWQTSCVGHGLAFGVSGGKVLAATPTGLTASSTAAARVTAASGAASGTSQVVPPQGGGNGFAFIIASSGSNAALYAVAAPVPTPVPSPSSTSTKPAAPKKSAPAKKPAAPKKSKKP